MCLQLIIHLCSPCFQSDLEGQETQEHKHPREENVSLNKRRVPECSVDANYKEGLIKQKNACMLATRSRSSGQAHQARSRCRRRKQEEEKKLRRNRRGIMRWCDSANRAALCRCDHNAYVENRLWLRIMLLLCHIVANMCESQDHSSVSLSKR